jgi:hypothetical protein
MFLVLMLAPTLAWADERGTKLPQTDGQMYQTANGLMEPSPEDAVQKNGPDDFVAALGLGARGSYIYQRSGETGYGVGGEMVPIIHPNVSLELAAEYQKVHNDVVQYTDVPVTFGVRLHLSDWSWPVSPYLVAAGGVDFVNHMVGDQSARSTELVGQFGVGIEFRLGHSVSLVVDARLLTRTVLDSTRAPDSGSISADDRSTMGMLVRGGLAVNL